MGKRWDTGDHGSIDGPLQDLWENEPDSLHLCPVPRHWPPRRISNRFNEWPIHLVTWDKVLFQGTSNIMCWLGDWIRLIHPMHWFQSLLRSNRRLKPQIS